MESTIKNYGFVPPATIEAKEYSRDLGSKVPEVILQLDGNWVPFLPSIEYQSVKFETFNCTAFNTLAPIEAIMKRRFNISRDYSDRFVGTLAGTQPPNNDPHKVAETIRKNGLIADQELPFSTAESIQEYFTLGDGSEREKIARLKKLGEIWLQGYLFQHEWVFSDPTISLEKKHLLMEEALKMSPLGASVYAWPAPENGVYHKPKGAQDTHWTTVVKREKDGRWLCFDTYNSAFKHLAPDYDFGFVKRYHVDKLLPDPEYYIMNEILLSPQGRLSKVLQLLKEILESILSKKQI